MYAWQVYEEGEWNIVAVMLNGLLTPLVTTRQHSYEAMRPYAELHHVGSGFPVRGVRYDEPVVQESWT